jgi:hypothetical protein
LHGLQRDVLNEPDSKPGVKPKKKPGVDKKQQEEAVRKLLEQ